MKSLKFDVPDFKITGKHLGSKGTQRNNLHLLLPGKLHRLHHQLFSVALSTKCLIHLGMINDEFRIVCPDTLLF